MRRRRKRRSLHSERMGAALENAVECWNAVKDRLTVSVKLFSAVVLNFLCSDDVFMNLMFIEKRCSLFVGL